MMQNVRWLTITEFANEWQKDPVTIRRWCYSGFCLKLGFKLHREYNGRWRIGIPESVQTVHTNSPLS
jgi:hypothetical protein